MRKTAKQLFSFAKNKQQTIVELELDVGNFIHAVVFINDVHRLKQKHAGASEKENNPYCSKTFLGNLLSREERN